MEKLKHLYYQTRIKYSIITEGESSSFNKSVYKIRRNGMKMTYRRYSKMKNQNIRTEKTNLRT